MTFVRNTTDHQHKTQCTRGDVVYVIGSNGKKVYLRVWEASPEAVFACSEQTYSLLSEGVETIPPVGFPISDIRSVDKTHGV